MSKKKDIRALKAIQQLDAKIDTKLSEKVMQQDYGRYDVTIKSEMIELVNLNKQAFIALQYHWETVKVGFLKSLEPDVKNEIERIYKEEIDPRWLPNTYCKGCYFTACQRLIEHFKL